MCLLGIQAFSLKWVPLSPLRRWTALLMCQPRTCNQIPLLTPKCLSNNFLFVCIDFRERHWLLFHSFMHHWLLLVCALSGWKPHLVCQDGAHQLSCPTRAEMWLITSVSKSESREGPACIWLLVSWVCSFSLSPLVACPMFWVCLILLLWVKLFHALHLL